MNLSPTSSLINSCEEGEAIKAEILSMKNPRRGGADRAVSNYEMRVQDEEKGVLTHKVKTELKDKRVFESEPPIPWAAEQATEQMRLMPERRWIAFCRWYKFSIQ